MENRQQVIGITGADGLLGSELMKIPGAIALKGDVGNPETMRDWPVVDYVINCASKTNVDWCESNFAEAWKINVDGVKNIVEWATKTGKPCIVQISSEMAINSTNVYGLTKFSANNILDGLYPSNHIILFTSHLFGKSSAPKKTFPNWVVEQIKMGKQFAVADIYCRPTWIVDIRKALEWMITGKYRGRITVVGPEFVSKYQHARIIEDKMVIIDDPITQSIINRNYGGFGSATRKSVDLWKEPIPRYSATTPLREATEIFLNEYLEEKK